MSMRGVGVIGLLCACAAAGCAPGAVDLDELDDFGRVGTALWVRLDNGDDRVETILVSTASRRCAAVQDDLQAFEDLQDDNGDMSTEEYYLAQAERMEPYMGAGSGLIYLTFDNVDDEGHIAAGDYLINSEQGTFGLTLVEYLVNPFEAASEAAASEGDVSGALASSTDRWLLASGQMTLTEDGDDALHGEVEGLLEAWEGGFAGSLEASFTAGYCEIAVAPGIIFSLLY